MFGPLNWKSPGSQKFSESPLERNTNNVPVSYKNWIFLEIHPTKWQLKKITISDFKASVKFELRCESFFLWNHLKSEMKNSTWNSWESLWYAAYGLLKLSPRFISMAEKGFQIDASSITLMANQLAAPWKSVNQWESSNHWFDRFAVVHQSP